MTDPRTIRQRKLAACVIAAGLLLLVGAVVAWERWEKNSAIEAALDWTRMSPIPAAATNTEVVTKGSMFTREFVVTFQLPQKQLQQWLAGSPGTKGATP